MLDAAASQTKTKILVSARDLYLEEGLKQVTMRKVAKRAGISPMATYRHFENKDDLISHVILEGFRIFQSYFYRSLEGNTAAERLWLCSQAYLHFALERPKYYEVMFLPIFQTREIRFRENGKTQIKAALRFLIDRVRECVDEGLMNVEDAKETALGLWSHSHGLASLYLAGRYEEGLDFPEFYRRSMATMLKGSGFSAPLSGD